MDGLNITPPISGTTYQAALPVVAKPAYQSPAPHVEQKQAAPATADEARYEEVKKAAQTVQSNYYVVSDVRFTIFKDLAGDYVTRFTSLKDGSVKYYPQKSLFEEMKIKQAHNAAIFHTQA